MTLDIGSYCFYSTIIYYLLCLFVLFIILMVLFVKLYLLRTEDG